MESPHGVLGPEQSNLMYVSRGGWNFQWMTGKDGQLPTWIGALPEFQLSTFIFKKTFVDAQALFVAQAPFERHARIHGGGFKKVSLVISLQCLVYIVWLLFFVILNITCFMGKGPLSPSYTLLFFGHISQRLVHWDLPGQVIISRWSMNKATALKGVQLTRCKLPVMTKLLGKICDENRLECIMMVVQFHSEQIFRLWQGWSTTSSTRAGHRGGTNVGKHWIAWVKRNARQRYDLKRLGQCGW